VTIELDETDDPMDEAFTIRGSELELRALQKMIEAAINKHGSSGVFNETEFLPVTLSIYCEEDDP
jgi:hypothetical protein